MPANTRQTDQVVQQQDAEIQGAQQSQLGGAVPMADEPIPAGSINALGATLTTTLSALTSGEMEIEFPEVQGPAEKVPDDIGSKLVALETMIEKFAPQIPELSKYAFSVDEALRTTRGVDDLSNTLDQLGRDAKVIKAMQQPAETETVGQEGETETEPNPME